MDFCNQNIFTNSEPDSYEETGYFGEDDIEHELNLDCHVDFDISGLFGSETNSKEESELKYKSEKDINEMIQEKNLNKEIKEKLYLDENMRSEEIDETRSELICPKKRRRRNKRKVKRFIIKAKEPTEQLLGRKRKNDDSKRNRDKFDTYNIIKKIKNIIINHIILSINNLILSLYTKKQINQILSELDLPQIKAFVEPIRIIRKIKHNIYATQTKVEENLEFLRLSIKKCLSNTISEKYKGIPSNANELIITRLLQDEKNKDTFDFIFNRLKIEEFLNIFTYQKDLNDYVKNGLNSEQILIINNSLIRIDEIDIIKKDGKIFFHCLLLLIYNLKYFIDKKERRNSDKIKVQENENNVQID